MRSNQKSKDNNKGYRYRPVLYFAMAYFFTWIFWVPAIFLPENIAMPLMLLGLIAPAAVSTVFILVSGSDALKKDLKDKIFGFYKVKWMNVILSVLVFALIVFFSILLSLAFGQSLDQFAFTEDFNFTGVGVAGALATIIIASILEEVGWKGYCEDSIGNYMNWFRESGLMVDPLFVINFFVSAIPMGFIITWVYLASSRSILACIIFHLFVNFMQEKIAMTPETKCVETIIVFIATAVIVIARKDMFFETRHIGHILDAE